MTQFLLKNIKNRKKGLTLFEMMISMLIFSLIMITVMVSIQSMTVARIKNMNRIALTDQLYLFSEQLFTEIKNGGTIDFEEYWNRKIFDTEMGSGHYLKSSGVGNFGKNGNIDTTTNDYGNGYYYCRSTTLEGLSFDGCAEESSLNDKGENMLGSLQRYGEYALQFFDFNSNKDNDGGDQDGDGNIVGDEDDVNMWNGPIVFSGAVKELYLTDKQRKTRTFFRWKIEQDSNTDTICEIDANGLPNDGCRGNVQILKLIGHDAGLSHENSGDFAFDGKIDTWTCDTQAGWFCAGPAVPVGTIATGKEEEWVNLFPKSINVRDIRFELYPQKDPWLSVSAPDCQSGDSTCVSPFIHPYVRIYLELGFSHGKRRSLRGENPVISQPITISLDDFK